MISRDIISVVAKFLPPHSLVLFARTCTSIKKYVYAYLRVVFNDSYLLLKFISSFNAESIARFLGKFFWDNVERETWLLKELVKDPSAQALYALFAPRDHVVANVTQIQQSLAFLLSNNFPADSALIKSLVFLVTISTGEFNVEFIPVAAADFHINLRGARLDRINLARRCLAYANLSDASLQYNNFSEANLYSANLRRAKLHFSFFPKANLQRANMCRVSAKQASFYDANMHGANILNADLSTSVMPKKHHERNSENVGLRKKR